MRKSDIQIRISEDCKGFRLWIDGQEAKGCLGWSMSPESMNIINIEIVADVEIVRESKNGNWLQMVKEVDGEIVGVYEF